MPEQPPTSGDTRSQVTRAFTLQRSLQTDELEKLITRLLATPGVIHADSPTPHKLRIRYDITKMDYPALTTILAEAGYRLATTPWNRIRSNWAGFADRNLRDGLKAPVSACCNKPPAKPHSKNNA